jgi:SAM-dependent methyltransferase
LSLSFRDPGGRLHIVEGRVFRLVTDAQAAPSLREALALDIVQGAIAEGRIVRSWERSATDLPPAVASETPALVVLEHERVPFPSHPYEWPPEMLLVAGRLTLDLTLGLLPRGFGLKDATPYNVLFRGPHPVFVDLLSIERRDPADPTWRAYAQFIRTFLSPLLANRAFGLRLDALLLTRRDGLEPEDLYRLAGPIRRLLPPFLTLATLPTWLGRAKAGRPDPVYAPRAMDPERARFVLASILNGLARRLKRLEPPRGARSVWSRYETESQYSARDHDAKGAFVEAALADHRPTSVLDIGCNTGRYSFLAARAGAQVVAADADPVVVGELWRRALKEGCDILPLVVDIARPSPAMGWRYGEHSSFLDRARGTFDLVLMLALVHHLTVGEGVPLVEVAGLAAELTRDLLIVEYVDPSDPQFHRLARGRDTLFAGLDRRAFESAFARHFETLRVLALPDAPRSLHLLRVRAAASR